MRGLWPITLAVLSNRTTWTLIGVPAKASTKAWRPALTVPMADPIEPESSTINPKLPPQRVRASLKLGVPCVLVASMMPRSVPPAVRLIELRPPPAPAASPPPLIVTTTRWALRIGAFGLATMVVVLAWGSPSIVPASSGSLTLMTHFGEVTPGVHVVAGGGAIRSRSTVVLPHDQGPLATDTHSTRTR